MYKMFNNISSCINTKRTSSSLFLLRALTDLGVDTEYLGVDIEYLGVETEYLGVETEYLGVDTE